MLLPKNIEDLPLLKFTLKIMKFWSFLIVHNYRRYLCLIPYFLINTTQFLDIYFSDESVVAIIRNAYICVLFFNTLLRAVLLCWQRFDYEYFIEELRLIYIELLQTKDEKVYQMVEETNRKSIFLAKLNLSMGFIVVIGFIIYPIFSTTKVLPFGIFIPGINKYQTPFYEIFFLLQITMSPSGCCMYIPFSNLLVSFILFAILMCKVLHLKLRNLQYVKPNKIYDELIWCIRFQQQLIRYVNLMNKLTAYLHLVEFMCFGIMLCVMLFLFLIVETIAQMVIVSIYIIMIFSQSFVLYYYANELYDQSLAITTAAYDSNWFTLDVNIQKNIKLMILRAQKPCSVSVGYVYDMNLNLLQSLLNATYSYFTLLKRVYG